MRDEEEATETNPKLMCSFTGTQPRQSEFPYFLPSDSLIVVAS
jgi:hypothetical protein